MPSQNEIIGVHPDDPDVFYKWFAATDHPPKAEICHRALTSQVNSDDVEVIEWLAEKIIQHHYSPALLARLKKKYTDLGFPKFAAQHRQIPVADFTRKGNATEIILVEYITNCQGRNLIKTFRLRYNPNVDQSMKGDDALLVDLVTDDKGEDDIKVILGEAKFRGTPSSAVLDEIQAALGKEKIPLSYSFLVQRLYEDPTTEDIAEHLENFLIEEVKAKGNLRYVGLLLSTSNTGAFVERHFTTDNPAMVIISAGIDQPAQLITNAFVRAQEILDDPDQL
jgi:hypothetical protein